MWTLAARRCLAVLLVLTAAVPAGAQSFGFPAPSTFLDTSIRSAAMGGAGAAVTWGEPDVWANPATLSGVSGIGWVAGHTKLAPEISSDWTFSSQRLLVGGGGLAFSLMGQPISGLGKAQLDFPLISGPFGDLTTTSDRTEGWGVGVSPLRLIESVRTLGKPSSRSLTYYGDLAFGYQAKESKAGVDPDVEISEGGTYDWGVTGRLALARWWGKDAPFRLDLSSSYSQINVLKSGAKNEGASTFQTNRVGAALHLSPTPPSERFASPPSLPWWRPGDVPALSMGLAYDHDEERFEPFGSTSSAIDHYGFEANVFRLLSLRLGYVADHARELDGVTYGGGVTLPVGPWGSVGYQLASVPRGEDVDPQVRQGWSVWLDPTRFWSASR